MLKTKGVEIDTAELRGNHLPCFFISFLPVSLPALLHSLPSSHFLEKKLKEQNCKLPLILEEFQVGHAEKGWNWRENSVTDNLA